VSTTFDVYPGTRNLPTFRQLLQRSSMELHRFLESVGVAACPQIQGRLQRNTDHEPLTLDLEGPLPWDADTYAWFMVGDVPGGTDAYFRADTARIRAMWTDASDDPRIRALEPRIRECADVGNRWWFRRSAGQPATINLAYGLIAGSLAALTEGFIASEDSAWDLERTPALPEDFLGFHFRPERALADNFREWSRRCVAALAEELRPGGK
jgi:hypothetical protein